MRLFTVVASVIVVLWAMPAWSQVRISHSAPASADGGRPFTIRFQLFGGTPDAVLDAAVFYRTNGSLTYRRLQAAVRDGQFEAVTDALPAAGELEYYIAVETRAGEQITLPESNPADRPFRLTLTEFREAAPLEGIAAKFEYRVMAPLADTRMIEDDALIAVALFPQDSTVTVDSVRLYMNGLDVTELADISPYLLTYVPETPTPGRYTAEVVFRNGAFSETLVSWSFEIVSVESRYARAQSRADWARGDVELTSRTQSTGGRDFGFSRGAITMQGQTPWVRYRLNGLLTTQEDPRLQPQNRFGAYLNVKDVFILEGGHVYPTLNPLLLAGRRVYGVNAELRTLWKNLNFQIVSGELNRRVPTLYEQVALRLDTLDAATNLVDSTYVLGFRDNGRGTHTRRILAGRVSFGNARYFQLGFNALKVKDDVNSIILVDSLRDVHAPAYLGGLSPAERNFLDQNPTKFQADRSNPTPQDNVVAGADIAFNLFNNRITFAGDLAASLLNQNIAPGVLTQEYISDLGFEVDQDILDQLDKWAWLFIVNENMSTLPIRFRDDEAEPYLPIGILAGQSRMGVNAFGHNLTAQYRWIGPEFISLANNGLRRDVAGYTVNDRFRLIGGTVYVNLGYEYLWDNLARQLDARTHTSTMSLGTSWYPVSVRLPRVSLNVRLQERSNRVAMENPFVDPAYLGAAVRNLRVNPSTNLEETLPTPRDNKTWQWSGAISKAFDWMGGNHDAVINLTDIRTNDQVFDYGDFSSRSIVFGTVTQWYDLPLRTQVSYSLTRSTSQGGTLNLDLTGLVLGGTYYLLEDQLSLTGELSFIGSDSRLTDLGISDAGTPDAPFDDYYEPDPATTRNEEALSYIGSFGAEYRFLEKHTISLSASLTNITLRGASTGSVPNDHFLQARYQFLF